MLHNLSARFALILSFSSLILSGCDGGIRGAHRDFVRYDAADDSFAVLHSWSDICCQNDKELNYLRSIWKRRNSIIVPPYHPFALWSVPAVERFASHRYKWIDLKVATSDETKETWNIDLDTIQVIPGNFFLNAEGNLCYFQQAVIPGKILDPILSAAVPKICDGLEQTAKSHLETIRQGKHLRPTWDQTRKKLLLMIERLAHGITEADDATQSDQVSPLNDDSLNQLLDARKKNSIQLLRTKDTFSIVLPLSAIDRRESITTFELIQEKIAELLKKDAPFAKNCLQFASAFSIRDLTDAGLEISMNLTKFKTALQNLDFQDKNDQPNPDWKDKYQSTINSMRDLGVVIEPNFALNSIIEKYKEK